MFNNRYMKKYQAISILISVTLDKRPFKAVCMKIPYANAKRTHLISDKVLSMDMTGYSKGYTKAEPCVIDLTKKPHGFGDKTIEV